MSQGLLNTVQVVIRSVGERTERLSKELVSQQGIDEKNIEVIHEVPFTKALERTFVIGLDSRKYWTLCLDADVLLANNSITNMLNAANNENENIFEIQGCILDKFIPAIRPGGIHLYRTNLLGKALKVMTKNVFTTRPETDTLIKMAKSGFTWLQIEQVVGIHDYEQFYSDIFRKCLVHSLKHQDVMIHALEIWDMNRKEDKDFEVAIMGAKFGNRIVKRLRIDKNFMKKEIDEILRKQGIKEKENLITFDSFSPDEIISNFLILNHNSYLNKYYTPTNEKVYYTVKGTRPRIPLRSLMNFVNRLSRIFKSI